MSSLHSFSSSSTPTTSHHNKSPRTRHSRAGSVVLESLPSLDQDNEKLGPIRILQYDDRNHLAVLTQLYGSVWPQVLPFCICNMAITLLVFYFLKDYTFAPTGHQFMSLILSFLVVTRAKITYSRFMEARGYLEECYKSCRELVQTMCVLTQEDGSPGAQVWRHNVAYRTILLLRVTMASIEFQSQRSNPWEIPELTQTDQEQITETLFLNTTNNRSSIGNLQQGDHSAREECFRAPLLLAYALRKEIMEQRSGAYLEKEFEHVNEELKLLDHVTDFLKGFAGMKKLVETPFPFPLVQMTRTFLFVWVFTLPLVLCHDDNNYPFDPLVMISLTTFGFIGIEFVCMELDDPFGDDPSDFDDLGMAQLVFEDIYISIYKLDGDQATYQLRRKIVARIKRGTALDNFQDDYQHGYSPTQEETIEYDRRLDFQKSKESPFYRKSKDMKKKKKKFSPSFKNVSMPTVPSFTMRKNKK